MALCGRVNSFSRKKITYIEKGCEGLVRLFSRSFFARISSGEVYNPVVAGWAQQVQEYFLQLDDLKIIVLDLSTLITALSKQAPALSTQAPVFSKQASALSNMLADLLGICLLVDKVNVASCPFCLAKGWQVGTW